MTLKEFGEKLNLSYRYIGDVELGKSKISQKALQRIAEILDEPWDQLMVAHGYLPDDALEAARKDPQFLLKFIRIASKEILESHDHGRESNSHLRGVRKSSGHS